MKEQSKGHAFLKELQQIDENRTSDARLIEAVKNNATEALQSSDAERFFALAAQYAEPEAQKVLLETTALLRLYFLIDAVGKEAAVGFPLFIENIKSFDALMERYTEVNLLLRRIEFDTEPGWQEAFRIIRERKISPYAVGAILYNPTSALGHREQILLKLASDCLSAGEARKAYGFLSVIEEPGEEAAALKAQLGDLIRSGKI